MVGNDIVDLKEAKNTSNWQRLRFLDKLFTDWEHEYIQNAENPFLMVWQLWSMKEAAYKLYTQIHPSRFYNPKAFECCIDKNSGIVRFEDFRCYIQTKTTPNYIVSEARLNNQKLSSEVVEFDHTNTIRQSEVLKSKLLKLVAKTHHVQEEALEIIKNEYTIPRVIKGSKTINISLAHHGRYGAVAI